MLLLLVFVCSVYVVLFIVVVLLLLIFPLLPFVFLIRLCTLFVILSIAILMHHLYSLLNIHIIIRRTSYHLRTFIIFWFVSPDISLPVRSDAQFIYTHFMQLSENAFKYLESIMLNVFS